MIEDPKWIFVTIAAVSGTLIYFLALKKNENKRPKSYEGYICPRCRQGFDEKELFSIWQFPTAPLRLFGWNHKKELDSFYCKRCRNIVNIILAISVIVTLPIIVILVYFTAYYLGLVNE